MALALGTVAILGIGLLWFESILDQSQLIAGGVMVLVATTGLFFACNSRKPPPASWGPP